MIAGIFFCEFDNNAGPVIRFQDPEGLISTEAFDFISDYIITKSVLCYKNIVISTLDNKRVMGYPVQIEHKKYLRNSILFNVGFVFTEKESNVEMYKPVVQKLAETFKAIEVESEYIYNEQKKEQLLALLPRIRNELNENHRCYIPIDDGNAICLRVFPSTPVAFKVDTTDEPIPIDQPFLDGFWDTPERFGQEDLGLRASIIAIKDNENSSLKKEDKLSRGEHYQLQSVWTRNKMDPALVRSSVQILSSCGLLRLVPSFDYNGFYAVTEMLSVFAGAIEEKEKFLSYIIIQEEEYNAQELVCYKEENAFIVGTKRRLPTFAQVFTLYCQLDGRVPYIHFIHSNAFGELFIHERRFIVFGLVNGFVKQISQ